MNTAPDLPISDAFQDVQLGAASIIHDSTLSAAEVDAYAGAGGAGISLLIGTATTQHGIEIYDQGMDLNTPGIQLNYFPNNLSKDLILSTDSVGNLVQKSFGSFF